MFSFKLSFLISQAEQRINHKAEASSRYSLVDINFYYKEHRWPLFAKQTSGPISAP